MSVKETQQVNIKHTTQPNMADTYRDTSRWQGLITSIAVHWPAGCLSLLEVGFGIDERDQGRIFPVAIGQDARVALDDVVKSWPLNARIEKGDNFWVEFFNYDTANPHTVSVILDVEKETC